jgi:hypothetical protein
MSSRRSRIYLDGTLLGANTKMLAEIFRRHGVEQSAIRSAR